MSSSESVLNEHWFFRLSARSRLLISFSSFEVAAPPTTFLPRSQALWAAAGAGKRKRASTSRVADLMRTSSSRRRRGPSGE
jgi:hypothetical protein